MNASLATAHILMATAVPRGFDYLVPEGMNLRPGEYISAPFGGRELRGVVWGDGTNQVAVNKLKPVSTHFAHIPPMSESLRKFVDWTAWYTLSARGSVLKMSMPVAEALKPLTSREREFIPPTAQASPIVLSDIQAMAAKTLVGTLANGFNVTLLDGVTGSGKTEVYFEAIAKAIETNGQVLVLLPEIALSVQWLERFQRRFGTEPYLWHSNVPPGQRKHTWRAIVNGTAKVVVGARSALFLPFKNLSMIAIDEEHDASYKQEDGVIYQARDMAIARARLEDIPIFLISATPSVETLYNVTQKKYDTVQLKERHAGATFPEAHVIDMRAVKLEKQTFIAPELRVALQQNLMRKEQSLLFLNRRGYAPLMLCRACGYRFQCRECTAWMVLHRASPKLQCHHCGYTVPLPKACPDCKQEDNFQACGPGVERIAEEVQNTFPQARVAMLTSDVVENFTALKERIDAMAAGEIDILIGTQIIAKGHHFAHLTLVGIVDADLGLGGGDLRAGERTYQLLHQLSGRAGREALPGRVLIQSFIPSHPVMKALVSGDRDHFMELELNLRQRGHLPPFSRLAAIIVEGEKEEQVLAHARALAQSAPHLPQWEVLGPAPAPLYLLRGKYRQRLLVRADRNLNIQKLLEDWAVAMKHPSSIRVKIDVDPYSFL